MGGFSFGSVVSYCMAEDFFYGCEGLFIRVM